MSLYIYIYIYTCVCVDLSVYFCASAHIKLRMPQCVKCKKMNKCFHDNTTLVAFMPCPLVFQSRRPSGSKVI